MTSTEHEETATESPRHVGKGRREADANRDALLARPRFSLRLQISLAFVVAFLLAVGVAAFLVVNFHRMESKIRFLEIVNDYVMEVEQARRFEKNFLLYGSNLTDALDNVFRAEKILTRNAGELAAVMGEHWSEVMLPKLRAYQGLLQQLGEADDQGGAVASGPVRPELQGRIRKEGQELVTAAQALLSKEKASLAATTVRSRQILISSLILMLLVMVLNAYLLGIRILRSINHLGQHARRIATGDFRPITPSKRFRDEFTDLALAINAMVGELEDREAVLIQSHKMRAVGTLTAGVAHELNNPLNNITLTAHVLQEDYSTLEDEERLEMIADVVAEAGRAKKIISNLLDFARESGSQLEPLDLPSLLQETINLAANQIKLMGIKIEFSAAATCPGCMETASSCARCF